MREAPTAVETALRALRHRDLSVREIEDRLRAKGFEESERDEALATLERTGLVDDSRFAESRARSLATRGAGDRAIRHALGLAGVAGEEIEDALQGLAPEAERAAAIVAAEASARRPPAICARRDSPRTLSPRPLRVASGDELG